MEMNDYVGNWVKITDPGAKQFGWIGFVLDVFKLEYTIEFDDASMQVFVESQFETYEIDRSIPEDDEPEGCFPWEKPGMSVKDFF